MAVLCFVNAERQGAGQCLVIRATGIDTRSRCRRGHQTVKKLAVNGVVLTM